LTNEIISILVNSFTFIIFTSFQDTESIPCSLFLLLCRTPKFGLLFFILHEWNESDILIKLIQMITFDHAFWRPRPCKFDFLFSIFYGLDGPRKSKVNIWAQNSLSTLVLLIELYFRRERTVVYSLKSGTITEVLIDTNTVQ